MSHNINVGNEFSAISKPWKAESDFHPGIKSGINIFKINTPVWAM